MEPSCKARSAQEELELRRGRSLDLLDEEQQYAYARLTDKAAVIVIFNNDTKPAEVSFDITFINKQIPVDAVKGRSSATFRI